MSARYSGLGPLCRPDMLDAVTILAKSSAASGKIVNRDGELRLAQTHVLRRYMVKVNSTYTFEHMQLTRPGYECLIEA